LPYPSGSPNVHDVPSGDIVPVTAVPSGLVTCRAVIVPWPTVIVTGAVGDSPAAPNADGTVTGAAAAAGVDAPVGSGPAATRSAAPPHIPIHLGRDEHPVQAFKNAWTGSRARAESPKTHRHFGVDSASHAWRPGVDLHR
jgi:hypothetical protein